MTEKSSLKSSVLDPSSLYIEGNSHMLCKNNYILPFGISAVNGRRHHFHLFRDILTLFVDKKMHMSAKCIKCYNCSHCLDLYGVGFDKYIHICGVG